MSHIIDTFLVVLSLPLKPSTLGNKMILSIMNSSSYSRVPFGERVSTTTMSFNDGCVSSAPMFSLIGYGSISASDGVISSSSIPSDNLSNMLDHLASLAQLGKPIISLPKLFLMVY